MGWLILRTSENSVTAKFAEFHFPALRWIEAESLGWTTLLRLSRRQETRLACLAHRCHTVLDTQHRRSLSCLEVPGLDSDHDYRCCGDLVRGLNEGKPIVLAEGQVVADHPRAHGRCHARDSNTAILLSVNESRPGI